MTASITRQQLRHRVRFDATGRSNETLGVFIEYNEGVELDSEGWLTDGRTFTDRAAWTAAAHELAR